MTINTVMGNWHIPLNKWLLAFYMMCASKTQVAALQLQRQLEIGSYRSAWFLCHRIRFALKEVIPAASGKLSGTVEADETYIGGKKRGRGRGYTGNKVPVVSLVERGGRVRSTVVEKVTGAALDSLLKAHIDRAAHLNTDQAPVYTRQAGRSRRTIRSTTQSRNTHGTTRKPDGTRPPTRRKASLATRSAPLTARTIMSAPNTCRSTSRRSTTNTTRARSLMALARQLASSWLKASGSCCGDRHPRGHSGYGARPGRR